MLHLTAPTVTAAGAGVVATSPSAILLVLLPLGAPVIAGAIAGMAPAGRLVGARATIAAAAAILAAGIAAAIAVVRDGALVAGSLLRIDALSAVMLVVIGAVGLIATTASVDYLRQELSSGETTARRAQVYSILLPAFLAAMVLAVLSDNLGLLWASIEATTVVTAFLVGHRRTRGSVEATWKYVIICSVGIALAYLGTVLVLYAARQAGLAGSAALSWTELTANAQTLDPGVMRIAFALLVLGFGAKAGMAPLHSWLPDAHSQAPAPVSALMSGVLLPVAVYALLRYRIIAAPSLGEDQVRLLLLVVAFASLTLAASLIIAQRDYKRLLAYSSIEHMALVVIGVAVGTPLAIAALLLHIVGHGLGKAVLFCGAGRILAAEGTSSIRSVRGLLSRRPALAAVFAAGIAALLGLPPFSLFSSEVGLARAGTAAGMGWVIAAALTLVAVIFVAITVHVTPMLVGPGTAGQAVDRSSAALSPLILALAVLAALGILAWPLNQLLHAASLIGGAS
jgi:hydrogenase-4 component F